MIDVYPGSQRFSNMLAESALRVDEFKFIKLHWEDLQGEFVGEGEAKRALVLLKTGDEQRAREFEVRSWLDADLKEQQFPAKYLSTKNPDDFEFYLYMTLAFSRRERKSEESVTLFSSKAQNLKPLNPLPYYYRGTRIIQRNPLERDAAEKEYVGAWKLGGEAVRTVLRVEAQRYQLNLYRISNGKEGVPQI